jgi:hypothetical protein
MAGFTQWIKKSVQKLLDPDKEERVQQLTQKLYHDLSTQLEKFQLKKTLSGIEYRDIDLEIVKKRVFRKIIARGWKDEILTDEEQKIAKWVGKAIELSEDDIKTINLEYAQNCFASALTTSLQDGTLDPDAEKRLAQITHSIGYTVPEFAKLYFHKEIAGFIRGLFLTSINDKQLSKDEWKHLNNVAAKLGISHSELLQVIKPYVGPFIEEVLANAKEDGILSTQEQDSLQWLIDNLSPSIECYGYVKNEIAVYRALKEIREGRLPVLEQIHEIENRAGEIVHFQANAKWRIFRMRKTGPRYDEHLGLLTLTDNRIIFSGVTKSQSINYRKIISHEHGHNWIQIQIDGKGENIFYFGDCLPLAYPIFSTAVALANQTRIVKCDGIASRHIPRDVRQRVWQRFGGRCADCGANDYLEFDHIIPVAKGGNNEDNNVQLLCRRCNIKKSDYI